MQYFEIIDKMAKEKSKLRSTTQGNFFYQNGGIHKSPEQGVFSLSRVEIDSLQQENFELKKKIQDMISEKTQMMLQGTSTGTSFHLGKTAITTNNTYFNEISQANLLKDLKKMEAKAEDRKKEIKRLFGLLKEKENEIEMMRRNYKMNISDALKNELNHVIHEFEGSLEKKYHDLEEELVNKQIQIDRLMMFIKENNLENRQNFEIDQEKSKRFHELEEKIVKIQDKLRKKEGLTFQKKQEYEEMLKFLLAEKKDFLAQNSDVFLRSQDPTDFFPKPPQVIDIFNQKTSKDARYSFQEQFKSLRPKCDFSLQVEIPSKDLEILKIKLSEAIKSKDEAFKSRDEAIKARDQAMKSKEEALKSREEALKSLKSREEALKSREEALKSYDIRDEESKIKEEFFLKTRDEALKEKEETLKELSKANDKMKNLEKNYQDRIKQINKDNNNIQERFQMVVKDLENEIIEKNNEIEELHLKLGGSLTSQHEKSLVMKELETLTGKILDDFSSIFKLLSINQQEFQHLDIECCFELLGKLLIQLLKEKNDLFENNKALKTRIQQQQQHEKSSNNQNPSSPDEKLRKDFELSVKKHHEELINLKELFRKDQLDLVQTYEEEKVKILEEIAGFEREIKDFFMSQELPKEEFESQDLISLLKLLIESYKREVDKYQTVSQEYHREYEAKINELESKRLLSQEDLINPSENEKLKSDFLLKVANLKEEHRRELETLALEKDNEKEEYINVLNEAMKDLYVQIRMIGSEKKQIENDNLKLKMKLSSEIQSKEELQGKSTKKEVEFSQKYADLQGSHMKLANENITLKTNNQELNTKINRQIGEFNDLRKSFENLNLKNGQELTMYKDKLISLSNEISDLHQKNDFVMNEFKLKMAEDKKNKALIEEFELNIREKEKLFKEIMDKFHKEEKINKENQEIIEDLTRKSKEYLDFERKYMESLEKIKEKDAEIKDFEKRLQESQNLLSEKTNKMRDLEGKSLVLTQGTQEKEEKLKEFLKECERDSQEKLKEIERISNEKESLAMKLIEKTQEFETEFMRKQDEIRRINEENEKLMKETRVYLGDIEGLKRRLSEEEEKLIRNNKDLNECQMQKNRLSEENQKNIGIMQEKIRNIKVLDENMKEIEKNLKNSEQKCMVFEKNLLVSEEKNEEAMRNLMEREKSLKVLEEKLKETQEKAKELEKNLKISEEKLKELERSLHNAENLLSEEKSQSESKIQAISLEKASLLNKNQDLISEIESKASLIQGLNKEKGHLNNELEKKGSIIEELNEKSVKEMKENQDLLRKYNEILSQKTVYELHLANQKDAIQDFEDSKSLNIQNINDLKEVLSSKDSELEEIKSQMLLYEETIKMKENEIKKQESIMKSKEKALKEEAYEELKEVEGMNMKLKEQLLQNQEMIFNLEQALKGLGLEKEALDKEIDILKEKNEEKQRNIDYLQREINEKEGLLQENQGILLENQRDLKEKEKLLMEFSEKALLDKSLLNQEIAQLQQENKAFSDKIPVFINNLNDKDIQIQALIQENQVLQGLNKDLNEKIAAFAHKSNEENLQIQSLIQENQVLQGLNKDLNEKFSLGAQNQDKENLQSPKEQPINFDNFNLFPDQGSILPDNSLNEDPILLRSQIAAIEENNKKLMNENKELREKLAFHEEKPSFHEEKPAFNEENMSFMEEKETKHIEKVKMKGNSENNEEIQKLQGENQELKEKLALLENLKSEEKPLGEDMFDNLESIHEQSGFINEDIGVLKEQIMILEDQLLKTQQENKENKEKLQEMEQQRILEKRGSKAGFDEQMLDYLEDQNEKSNANNDRSEIDYKLMEEQSKNMRLELEHIQKDSNMKIKTLELKVEEKDMEILKLLKNMESLNEGKEELDKQIKENKALLEKLTQIPKLENEHILLKMKIENLTIKVSSLEKELQNVERKLRLELEDLLDEPLAKTMDLNDIFYEGFGKLKALKEKFENQYKTMKTESQEEILKKQEKLYLLSEENQKLEKANETLMKDYQKKLNKREAESKQMILMSNVFEKLFNEILRHSEEIEKEQLLELFELETKNKEHVDKIIEKINTFLKKSKEKSEHLKELEDNLANLANKSKQLEVLNAEKENKLQEINQKLESMSHQKPDKNQKNSFSSIEADFSQLFAHKGNDLLEVC